VRVERKEQGLESRMARGNEVVESIFLNFQVKNI